MDCTDSWHVTVPESNLQLDRTLWKFEPEAAEPSEWLEHSVDDFAVVPWAFDGDVDDKVSESHWSGASCMAGDRDPMSSDYIDVPSVLDSCSSYYSSGDTRADYSDVAAAAAAEEAAVVAAAVTKSSCCHLTMAFGSEPARESAKLVVLRNWNCFVFQLTPVVVLEWLAAMGELEVHFSVYPMHQSIPYYACQESSGAEAQNPSS